MIIGTAPSWRSPYYHCYVWVATQLRERSERNKNPPAMRVEDKKLYKKHLSRLY